MFASFQEWINGKARCLAAIKKGQEQVLLINYLWKWISKGKTTPYKIKCNRTTNLLFNLWQNIGHLLRSLILCC